LRAESAWSQAARARLVEAWLSVPDNRYLELVVHWSRELGRWDLLDRIWRERLCGRAVSRYPEVLAVFRSLPEAARRQRPALTWAMGLAEARYSDDPLRIAMRTVIHDGVLLHSSWHLHDDLDAAVTAASIWMYCQRMLPADGFARALSASSRTGAAVERLIDAKAQQGVSPSDLAQTVLAIVSAQTALGLGDLAMAASKASLATILKGAGRGMDAAARGIVQLSQSVCGVLPLTASGFEVPPRPQDGDVSALAGQTGWLMSTLARGLRALDRLDRTGCEEALHLVRQQDAWGSRVGAVHAYLEAVHGALWLSPERALANLDAAIATNAGRSSEALEPLGARLIGRARTFILCRLGAIDAAQAAATELPEQCRRVTQARAHLHIGEFDEAARVATEGLLDSRTLLKDRVQLTVLKNVAAVMDPMASAEEKDTSVRLILQIAMEEQMLVPLALPRRLREEILCRARTCAEVDLTRIRAIEDRLSELVDVPDSDAQRVRLTGREEILLPLLATSQTVPEIAKSLHVSPNTVRKQVASLREKFQAGTRADLIRHARHAGFLR
jgi:DNA-binding CsgD family transcriptional regulator